MAGNRTAVGVIVAMIAAFVVGGLAVGTKKKSASAKIQAGVRAVIVPTTDAARRVVVGPCDAPAGLTVRNLAAGRPTPGATTVELPRSPGARAVVVPGCQAGLGTGANLASAVFVPKPGALAGTSPSTLPQSRVLVPAGSQVTTIVIPPCRPATTSGRAAKRPDVVLRARAGSDGAVSAPPC
jgi:hypothetical protein